MPNLQTFNKQMWQSQQCMMKIKFKRRRADSSLIKYKKKRRKEESVISQVWDAGDINNLKKRGSVVRVKVYLTT